jgi:putative flippase GtrA
MSSLLNHSFARFTINGLVATCVHYVAMVFAIHVLGILWYSLAYAFAFLFAVVTSFWGNKRFVFKNTQVQDFQFVRFVSLYVTLLFITSLTMWAVSDYGGFHYNVGFIIALMLQFIGGYLGSRYLIFL